MFKIAWKSFWYNIKNFIVFFLSAILSVTMIFGFMYLTQLTREISVGGLESGAGTQLGHSVVAIFIVSICIMVYSARTYIRSRMKDYSMLLILGIRKKQLMVLVMLEYLFSWIVSTIVGLLGGNLLVTLFRKIMAHIAGDEISFSYVDKKALYTKVLLLCVLMIIGVVVVLIGYLSERDLSSLLQTSVKKEKKPNRKTAMILLITGILLVIGAVVLARQTNAFWGMPSAIVMGTGILGVYLIIAFGVNIWFEEKKKKEKHYYKNLLGLNNFYYHFYNNVNVIAGQIAVGLFFIYLIWTVSGGIWETHPEEYPYDFVCITPAKQEENLKAVCEEQPGEKKMFPYVGCYYGDVPLIGMSQSLCKEILGENCDLNKEELVYLWGQGDGFVYEGDEKMGLFAGWENRLSNKNMTNYKVKYDKQNLLFGPWTSSVAVLSDEEYNRLYEQNLENYYMVTINTEKENVDAVEMALKEGLSEYPDISIYSKKTLLRLERLEGIVRFSIVLFSAVSLFLFLLFTLCIKIYSDLPDMKERYRFLDTLGMKRAEKRKTVKKEITILLLPPAFVAAALGFLYCCAFSLDGLRRQKLSFHFFADYSIPSALWILPQMAVYLAVMVIFTLIMRQLAAVHIEK